MSRIALVTGAAQGIGRAIALRLAKDGLNVAVNDTKSNSTRLNDTKQAIENLGRKSLAVLADVSSEKEVETMMKSVVNELGALNVLVANAGICEANRLIDITVEDWERTLSINLRGVFLCYREAAKTMIKQGKGGKIIAACSIAGYRSYPLASHYSASKWGVRGLTQAAALELAPHQITVNAYCPGATHSNLLEETSGRISEIQKVSKEEFAEGMKKTIALGRMGEPEDVANFVSYLASADSNYMTGQSVIIDGGVCFS